MLRELTARPLLLLLLGFLVGLNLSAFAWIFGLLAVILFGFKKPAFAVPCIGIFLASIVLAIHPPKPVVSDGKFEGTVVIRSFPTFLKGQALYGFETLEQTPRVGIFKVDQSEVLSPFSIVEAEGTVNKGKSGNFHPNSYRIITSSPLLDTLVAAQRKAIEKTNQMYGKEDGAWVSALTFNFPSDLSSEEKNDLRFNGTYHMVSASGMHVWVIAFFLHFILVQLGVPRPLQLGIVTTLLLAYCAITGFHAPTLRASMMWLIGASAYLFRRTPDGLSALCLSALIWLSFVPSDVFTAGFQLSYIVSGCLLLWFERKQEEETNEFRSTLEASLVATVAAEPLCAWWFGRMVFIGPISNILIALSSSAVMVLGFLGMIPFIGPLFVYVARPLIWWMQWTTDLTAKVPVWKMRMHFLPSWYYVLLYFILFAFLLHRRATHIANPRPKKKKTGSRIISSE
jgi:ComEC/Rec2-related protein